MNHRLSVLVYGDIGGSGGYVRYCKGLFGSGAIPSDTDVTFVCSTDFYEKIRPLDSRVRVIAHPWPSNKFRALRYLWHLVVYPRIVKRVKPDIEFYPSGQTRVYLRRALTVATCHNLLLFDDEELNRLPTKKEKEFFSSYRRAQSKSLSGATGVIFLSAHSRRVVQGILQGISNSTVIGHGLDPVFRLSTPRTYSFHEHICILYVSPFYAYKHQESVVRATREIRDRVQMDIQLRLIGGGSPDAVRTLRGVIQRENADAFVEIVGMVGREALVEEYEHADIFVFASASETFGITLLEAMGARLPIACSDRTGLKEILKDGGLYFNPESPSSIAMALETLIKSQTLRKDLGEKAHLYSEDYTWERCTIMTFEFIRRVFESNHQQAIV